MRQIITSCIVLSRVDFQEADRILTVLTPDNGKVGLIAKGTRRPRSKLAGGIELLSISNITYLVGRGEISTLISSRLEKHYGSITKDIRRTMLAYELLKRTNKVTEDAADEEFFELLKGALEGLNDDANNTNLVELWYNSQLLRILGYSPNLTTDKKGQKLTEGKGYMFDYDSSSFDADEQGPFSANDIKILRLTLNPAVTPDKLNKIGSVEKHIEKAQGLIKSLLQQNVLI